MLSNHATNIALIDKASMMVTNVIWGNIYLETDFTNDVQIAVVIDDLAVGIGDTYDGAHFYHEGERVVSIQEKMADM